MISTLDIQRRLKLLGYDVGQLDGVMGTKTTKAIRAFQRASGLEPDAIVGPITAAALLAATDLTDDEDSGPFTRETLSHIAPKARNDLIEVLVNAEAEFREAGVVTPLRMAHFLAQIATETGGLRTITENMNYSARRLTQVWPGRFPTLKSAQTFANNPEKLANKVYGGRLGNTQPGDGWRYRGGGMMQTTGRDNYRRAGHEHDPESLRKPYPALVSALKYWSANGLNALADRDDLAAVRKRINGGKLGIEEARRYLTQAKEALGV